MANDVLFKARPNASGFLAIGVLLVIDIAAAVGLINYLFDHVEVDDLNIYHYNWRNVNDVTIEKSDITSYEPAKWSEDTMVICSSSARISVMPSVMANYREFLEIVEAALAESSIRSRGFIFRKD